MRRVLLRLVVLVVLLVLAVTAYGASVPTRHRAASVARYQASHAALWEAISDFEGQASWRKGVESVERLPDRDGHPAWMVHAGHHSMPLVVTEIQEGRLLTTATPPDADLPFSGSWTWQISDAEDARLVTIIEDGEIFNPFFRGMAALFLGYHGTMDDYLVQLGRKFGEDVTPRPIPQAVPR